MGWSLLVCAFCGWCWYLLVWRGGVRCSEIPWGQGRPNTNFRDWWKLPCFASQPGQCDRSNVYTLFFTYGAVQWGSPCATARVGDCGVLSRVSGLCGAGSPFGVVAVPGRPTAYRRIACLSSERWYRFVERRALWGEMAGGWRAKGAGPCFVRVV